MRILRRMTVATAMAVAVLSTSAWAEKSGLGSHKARAFTYEVTITNITKNQVFSPPVLVTHAPDIALFEVGAPAIDELAIVAEDGDGQPLVDLISTLPAIFYAQTTSAPIPPGGSEVYEVPGPRRAGLLSIVSMLVNSNDAFFAIDSAQLPRGRFASRQFDAPAYDAGSEANNETCAFVPGPACPPDSGNARATVGAEGYIYIHNGIHGVHNGIDGVGKLSPDQYDWNNPVARVTVKRIR